MKKALLVSALCLAAATASAATTLIDGCEDTAYTIVVSPTTPVENDLTLASTATSSEGTNALEVTVDYGANGQWVIGSNFTKDFATPIDVSDMEYFSYDISVPVAADLFIMQVQLIDSQGIGSRFLDYSAFSDATSGFETHTFHISNLQKSKWYSSGRAPNLKSISQMRFIIGNEYGETTSTGSFSFSLDNVQFESDAYSLDEIVVEDFESYGSDGDLQTAWPQAFSQTSDFTLNTTDPYGGSQSGALDADIQAQWTNYARKITFSEPLDMSTALYMRMAIKGDSALAGYEPTAHIYLEDVDGNRVIGYVWKWAAFDEWSDMWMPFQADGIPAFINSSWEYPPYTASWCLEDRWDDDEFWENTTDRENIAAMIIAIEIQGAASPAPGPVTIGFDDITIGFAETMVSQATYTVNKLDSASAVPTIDGVADAGEWDAAASPGCTNFVLHDDPLTSATEDPEVKAVFDNDNLYVLVQVTTADLTQTWSGSAGDDENSTGDKFPFYFLPDGNMGTSFYRVSLVPDPNGTLYMWDEADNAIGYPGVASWNADNDGGDLSYDTGTDLLTIEYMIPWTDFDFAGNEITAAPVDGDEWGIQIGYSNEDLTSPEYVNWEPDDTAGYIAGYPFGTWTFSVEAPTASESWELYK